jgi:hypothetical protein
VSDLRFEIRSARAEPYAAVPTLMLRLAIRDAGRASIHAVGLRIQIQIESQRRHYNVAEEDRLLELFGEPGRWGETLRTMLWTHVAVMVPAFDGEVEIDVPIACSYDFEVAASKYFHALDEGEIPLLLQFSGTVFARTENGFAVDQIGWNQEASFRLPVHVWREMMDLYFPDSGWIRLRRDTLDALHRFRGREVLTTWEETIDVLLKRAGADEREPV